jgi:hypothetical protein
MEMRQTKPGRRFVFGQYASQIQRQQLLKLSHNEDFAFGICFLIERHHGEGAIKFRQEQPNAMHHGHDLWLKVIKERSEKQN